jgi:hypothetical protein
MTKYERNMTLACIDKLEYIHQEMTDETLDDLLQIEIIELSKLIGLR